MRQKGIIMIIGLISDSHDNIPIIKKAVKLFDSKGVEYIIHAGDYVAPFAVKELLKVNSRFVGVFGNNDGEKKGIKNICDSIYEGPFTLRLNNKTIIVIHAIEDLDGGKRDKCDIIIYGHTHKPEIKNGKPFTINPGECGGWLSGICTVGILNLDKMEVEIINITDKKC